MRTTAVKAHITPLMKQWVQRLAAEKGVSVSTYLAQVYKEHAENKRPGCLPKPIIAACAAMPARPKAIYLIGVNGLTKIGKSVKPKQRIQNMQLPSKPEWVHIHWVPNADQQEKELHRMFASSRRHGEWFALTAEQLHEAKNFLASCVVEIVVGVSCRST
jgi:hypothetical protein